MGKKSAPAAPDYTAAAVATANASKQNTAEQTAANRPNLYTPWGSQTWTSTPGAMVPGTADNGATINEAAYYAANPDVAASGMSATDHYNRYGKAEGRQVTYNDVASPAEWTSQITLSPEQQAALNDQMAIQSGRSNAALGMLHRATSALGQPLDYSGLPQGGDRITAPSLNTQGPTGWDPYTSVQGDSANWEMSNQMLGDSANWEMSNQMLGDPSSWAQNDTMQRTAGDWRQQAQDAVLQFQAPLHKQAQAQLESQLANMGLTRGSEAWNNELQGLQDRQARDQLQAFDSGRQEAQMLFNQDLAASQFGNQARNTQFQQDLARSQFGNQARNTQFQQDLARSQFGNQSAAAQFARDLSASQFGNQARAQGFGQDMASSQFGNQALMQQLQGQQSAGSYNQMLRQQQLAEMLGQRVQPLNELNALLAGQQVQNPQMPSFSQAGVSQAPNYLGAAQSQYQASLDAYNAQQQQMAGLTGGLFNLGSAAMRNPAGWAGLFKF